MLINFVGDLWHTATATIM